MPVWNRLRGLVILPLLAAVAPAHGTEYTLQVGEQVLVARTAAECFELSEHVVGECVSRFFDASEQALARAFTRVHGHLLRDAQLVQEAQSTWEAFRRSECEVRSVSAQAFRDPERQTWLFVRACAAELNAQRVLQLDALTLGCDSCLQ